MGWKGVVRSISAASRAAARERERQQRQYQKRMAAVAKQQVMDDAQEAAEEYEAYVAALVNLHADGVDSVDWQAKSRAESPPPPMRSDAHEIKARTAYDKYRPSIMDKILGRKDRRLAELRMAIESAKQRDEDDYKRDHAAYLTRLQDLEAEKSLADALLSFDSQAFLETIEDADPFSAISGLGSKIEFSVPHPGIVTAILHTHGDTIIPKQSVSLLKSGKISVRDIPKSQFNKLHQDHVCSAMLRIARDLFALLPARATLVIAKDELLDASTGHHVEMPIASFFLPRETFTKLNLEKIDPSDACERFLHAMNFKPTTGFRTSEPVQIPEEWRGKS